MTSFSEENVTILMNHFQLNNINATQFNDPIVQCARSMKTHLRTEKESLHFVNPALTIVFAIPYQSLAQKSIIIFHMKMMKIKICLHIHNISSKLQIIQTWKMH